MEDRAPYWQQIRLTSGGDIKRLVQPAAQAFLRRLEAELDSDSPSERTLQQRLMTAYCSSSPDQALAEACLRNFITHVLHQRCLTLASRFGRGQFNPNGLIAQTPFTAIELFCCVFESPLASSPTQEETDREFYDPLITKILTSFDPDKGSLATWCTTRFQGSRAVKRFLREHGIVLETDWQLLCRIRLGKLQRLLTAANCTTAEIEAHIQLLTAFHNVYRTQLDEQRQANPSRRPYPAPTEQQLLQISHSLSLPTPADAPTLRRRLKQLAQYVRQDRCRGPSSPKTATSAVTPDRAVEELLESYCQPCLVQAVEQTVEQRLVHLQQKRKGATKADQFLQALTLFYCESQPMKEIAAVVGLRDQPSVSRLLKRDDLQADIRRQVLDCLLQRVCALATAAQSPARLQRLDQQISAFLEPYVEGLIAADQREGYTSKHRQMTSAYATQLCHCATARRNRS
ncbi:MAG: hypothetical protein F6K04_11760 [Leptolyngbya sp. SIO4C5]|nr:hypothetical protein [Leptolyngbya sp. SIO4C5]